MINLTYNQDKHIKNRGQHFSLIKVPKILKLDNNQVIQGVKKKKDTFIYYSER